MTDTRYFRFILIVVCTLCFVLSGSPSPGFADTGLQNEFGGQLRFDGSITSFDDESFYQPVGTETGYDGAANLRLTDTLFLNDTVSGEIHYESYLVAGDTYRKNYRLRQMISLPESVIPGTGDTDKRRLFNLSGTIKDTEDYSLTHRLDRLFVSWRPSWGNLTVGRQAVTWGNGLVFNPMDLFNPFAPSDTVRDYKMGDDLLSIRFNTQRYGETQLLFVPRRDPVTGDLETDQSSLAGKTHLFAGTTEFDLMAAVHFNEAVFGAGSSGYLGDAAWRTDCVWSTLRDDNRNGYITFIANVDYSWIWFDKNVYGLCEYYFNSLGHHRYDHAFSDSELIERLDRGEMFTLGRHYLNGQIQVELHPLFNFYLSLINNMKDPSGLIQPRCLWNISQNILIQFGINTHYGNHGSEYGGIRIPGTTLYTTSPDTAYAMATWFF